MILNGSVREIFTLGGLKPIDQWSLLEYKKIAGIPLADAKEKWQRWEERKVQIEMSKAEKEIFGKLDCKIQNFILYLFNQNQNQNLPIISIHY